MTKRSLCLLLGVVLFTSFPEAVLGEGIQTNGGEEISLASLEHQDETSGTVVYYTPRISVRRQ